jgi:polygalacturonase
MSCDQYLINNGVSSEDAGDITLRCLRYVGQRTDTAMLTLAGLPTDVSSFASTLSTLTTDMTKLKNYLVYNVKEYGATGDGSTDDTTSINNTIAALPSTNCTLYFPPGIYKVTARLYINAKTNLMIKSDNAVIATSFNGDTLYLNSCTRTTFSGDLTINWTGTASQTSNNALVLSTSNFTTVKHLSIFGDFLNGMKLLVTSSAGSTDVWPSIISNNTIRGCRTGIQCAGEYYNLSNNIIYGCISYGVHVNQVGNVSIDNCSITVSNIGIYVAGLVNNNSDHGRITSCTLNHNAAANIYLSNLVYSWSIIGNQIWAALGPNRLSITTATSARTGSFGIYAENCINLNIIGNHIARNNNNIGLDGCLLSNISNNHILGAPGVTGAHIAYYGNTNTGAYGSSNSQSIITNNIHENVLTSGFKFIYFNDNITDRNIYVKGNRGTLTNPFNNINSVGTYNIDCSESWSIDANAIGLINVNAATDSPDTQATNINVLSHMIGEEFTINFYNVGKWVWIRFKTDNTTNVIKSVGNGVGQHFPAKKAIPISTDFTSCIKFVPLNNAPNGWLIVAVN